eukprot:SAG31_NODE_15275_length_762_cov_6.986425_1_plen_74_part_00
MGWQEGARGVGLVVHRACSSLVCQWLLAVVGKARVGVDGGANSELRRSEVGVGRFFEAYELSFPSSVLVVCEA